MDEDVPGIDSLISNLAIFQNNESYRIVGPELTVSDYIEVVYNLAAMVFGVPINFWALHGHLRALRSRPAHARLIWLGINLTLANLMTLLIHSVGTAIWLLTHFWYGGDLLCRLFKCLSIMSFHISSNVVVSIALDMFHSLHAPLRSQIKDARKRVRLLLIISWSLAALLSLPQLYVWGEMDDFMYDSPNKQCAFLFYSHINFTRMYNFAHLLFVFYIPLLFILFCYVGSAYHVWKHLRLQSSLIQHHNNDANRKQSMGSSITMNLLENNYRRQSNVNGLLVQQQRRFSSNVDRQTRTKMRLLRKSASVIGGYVICWLPYQIFSVWQSFCDYDCEQKHYEVITTKLRWLEALMISCACINPFLYTFVRHRHSSSSDSPRRNSHDAGTGAVHGGAIKRDSFLTSVSKRDSLLANGGSGGSKQSQLTPLRKSSCVMPKYTAG